MNCDKENHSEIDPLTRMFEEKEFLHKELALLAKKSENCEPELLADYAVAMCELFRILYL